jgi:alcohol dehydrogenase (NADP+)
MRVIISGGIFCHCFSSCTSSLQDSTRAFTNQICIGLLNIYRYFGHAINGQWIFMRYFTFNNGDRMPMLGLGTWKSNEREAYHAVREAIRIGYRHIDCAARYENEQEIGEAIAEAIEGGEVRREDLWVTSKLWNNAHLPPDVLPALKQTLRDLRLDYLDLYLMHWPVAIRPDVIFPYRGDEFLSLHEAPLIDTWQAMEFCQRQGLCRHIGVSNFNIPKMEDLMAKGGSKPECNQVESHPFFQQRPLLDYCLENQILFTAYSPLGSMDRPPRLKKDNDPLLLEHPVILQIARELNASPAQTLIAWALQRGTAVIPKSANPQRLLENFTAEQIQLSPEQVGRLNDLERGFRFVNGSIWTFEGSPYTLDQIWNR